MAKSGLDSMETTSKKRNSRSLNPFLLWLQNVSLDTYLYVMFFTFDVSSRFLRFFHFSNPGSLPENCRDVAYWKAHFFLDALGAPHGISSHESCSAVSHELPFPILDFAFPNTEIRWPYYTYTPTLWIKKVSFSLQQKSLSKPRSLKTVLYTNPQFLKKARRLKLCMWAKKCWKTDNLSKMIYKIKTFFQLFPTTVTWVALHEQYMQ